MQPDRTAELAALLEKRILLLDGAMGTMIQSYHLDEAGYRGACLAGHDHDVKGDNDVLALTQPDIVRAIHNAYFEAGAEDLVREGDQYVVTTTPGTFHAVQDALRGRGLAIESAELAMVPKNTVKVEGADAERILRLGEVLEELDDVSKVFSNFDIDAAQLAEAEA